MSIFQIDVGEEWKAGQCQSFYVAKELKRRGLSFVFIVRGGSLLHQKALEAEFPAFALRIRNGFDPGAMFKLARMMKRKKCLLVHFYDDLSLAVGSAAASLAKVRHWVISRDFYSPLKRGSLARRKYKKKMDAIIVGSEGIKKIMIEGGINPARIEVIPSGIDFSPFEKDAFMPTKDDFLRRELSFGHDDFLVGIVANLADPKCHKYLLQATKILKTHSPKIKMIILGEAPFKINLDKPEGKSYEGDLAFFLGFREDRPRVLASLDLFVHYSRPEAMGSIILDAMASRLPVVAAHEEGFPEVIIHGETGLLVSPRSSSALAKAVLKFYDDRDLAYHLGQRGYRAVHQKFSCEAMAEKVLVLYEKIGLRKWIRLHSRA